MLEFEQHKNQAYRQWHRVSHCGVRGVVRYILCTTRLSSLACHHSWWGYDKVKNNQSTARVIAICHN